MTFSALGGGPRSHSLGEFFAAQKTFVSLKKAPKQTLCSLVTSDMLAGPKICIFFFITKICFSVCQMIKKLKKLKQNITNFT